MKNLRFSLLTVLLTLTLVLFNTGCDSDDSGNNPSSNPLVGTWELSTVTVQGISLPVSTLGIFASIVTREDGTFTASTTYNGDTESSTGTWSSTSSTITLSADGESYTLPYDIENNVLTITASDDLTAFMGLDVDQVTFVKR